MLSEKDFTHFNRQITIALLKLKTIKECYPKKDIGTVSQSMLGEIKDMFRTTYYVLKSTFFSTLKVIPKRR